jgi:hypothetical protein
VPEAIENEVICMRVAQSIFDDFNSMPEQHPKYTFPFLHYLTNATIIALGLIIKQSSFKRAYGQLTLKAARSLWDHCRKTWVSGRMARTVWRLNKMADATISHPRERLQDITGDICHNKDQSVMNGLSHSPSPTVPGAAPTPSKLGSIGEAQDLFTTDRRKRNGSKNIQCVDGPSASRTSDALGFDQPINTDPGFKRHFPYPDSSNVRNSEISPVAEDIGYKQAESRHINRAVSEAAVHNDRSHFEMTPAHSFEPIHMAQDELDVDISFPGEMIDGGMEWLQSLFVNGLDTNLPPVWD